MNILNFLKKNFSTLLILLLLVLLYLKNCNAPKPPENTVTVVHDTVYIHHDSTVFSKPEIVTKIVPKLIEIPQVMQADTANCEHLKQQYNDLVIKHLTKNITTNTLNIDSIGYVSTIDTVQANQITGRQWKYDIKERVVTNTITIREAYKPRNQIYAGIEIGVTQLGQFDQASLGLMLKNKKDNIIGVSIGYNPVQNSPYYGLKYYKKLSFR